MTREEFMTIVKALKAVYTSTSFIPDKNAFDVWYGLLQDLPYEVVSKSAQYHMSTSERYPTIANLRHGAKELTEPKELNEIQAWSLVSKAIRNSAYHSVEEFAKLPPLVQQAVGQPNQLRTWATDSEYNEQVTQSLFGRTYKAVAERAEKVGQTSKTMQGLFENTARTSYFAQIEQENALAVKSLRGQLESNLGANLKLTGVSEKPQGINQEHQERLDSLKADLRVENT